MPTGAEAIYISVAGAELLEKIYSRAFAAMATFTAVSAESTGGISKTATVKLGHPPSRSALVMRAGTCQKLFFETSELP